MRRRGEPRALCAEARRVVADLHRDGVATTSIEALVGGGALLEDVLARTDDLVADQSADIVRRRRLVAGEPSGWAGPLHERHAVELLGAHPAVEPEDPYTRFLRHPQVAGVAAGFCRRDVHVRDMNGLLTLAAPPARPADWTRTAAGPALEVALHLTDVDEGTGALHYVRTSHRGRGARRVRGLERSGRRIEDTDLRAAFGADAPAVLDGRAGTVVFFDPRGLHRTWRPTTRDRLVLRGAFTTRRGERTVLLPADGVRRGALADSALA